MSKLHNDLTGLYRLAGGKGNVANPSGDFGHQLHLVDGFQFSDCVQYLRHLCAFYARQDNPWQRPLSRCPAIRFSRLLPDSDPALRTGRV